MVKGSEPGKWIVGAGLLLLGIFQIIAGLSLGFGVDPLYFILTLSGAYLACVIINDQFLKNLKLPKHKSDQ